MRLRGRALMVLAPIANPKHARGLLGVAHALAPAGSGRVVLLNVLQPPERPEGASSELPKSLVSAQAMLGEALSLALAQGWAPETLMTIAPDPWTEIGRVARLHACHVLLLGMSEEAGKEGTAALDGLIGTVACDVVVLYAPPEWQVDAATRILVPVAGRGGYDRIRSQILGSLCRTRKREVTFLRILPESASEAEYGETASEMTSMATDAVPDGGLSEVVKSNDVTGTLAAQTRDRDLMILGMSRQGRREKVIGNIAIGVAAEAHCPIVLISTAG
jgi:nucleotide-binding universal stress UspA family protein